MFTDCSPCAEESIGVISFIFTGSFGGSLVNISTFLNKEIKIKKFSHLAATNDSAGACSQVWLSPGPTLQLFCAAFSATHGLHRVVCERSLSMQLNPGKGNNQPAAFTEVLDGRACKA